MASNFHNLKDSGSACVGCGRTSDQVMLKRLRNYSVSLACGACLLNPKYAMCHNVDKEGNRCGHNPHPPSRKNPTGKCPECPCLSWRHGLESEHDRQYANAVGAQQHYTECKSFGSRTCGRIILVGRDGTIPRLCDTCERDWIESARQQHKEVSRLLDMDETKEIPQ